MAKLRIKEVLAERGLMQKDLAQMLGITPAAINKSMDGSITFDKLGRISAALNVPIAVLIDDPSTPPKVCPYCGSPLESIAHEKYSENSPSLCDT